LTATDEQVHIWYYDRQGGIQSYGLNILKNLPHFFVLLLSFQRLDLEGWGFVPSLSFDADSHSSAQLEVTLHKPAGGLGALVQQPVAYVKFTPDQVKGHVPELLGSQIPAAMETQLVHQRMGTQRQAHFPETRAPRHLVITASRKLRTMWDLTADGFFKVWSEALLRKLDCSMPSVHD